jgi:probable rRNA maturation factor
VKQVDIPAADLSSANEIFISFSEVEPPPWIKRCRVFCLKALNRIGVTNWEVSLLFCNNAVIRGLNSRFRGYDKATDVLSFPQAECPQGAKPKAEGRRCPYRAARIGRPVQGAQHVSSSRHGGGAQPPVGKKWPAGDVVISLDTLQRNAEDNNISADEELKRLLIHGFLHLKGMDHHEEKSEMLKIQESILEEFMEERII